MSRFASRSVYKPGRKYYIQVSVYFFLLLNNVASIIDMLTINNK